MAITIVTLTGNVADLIGVDFQARRTKVWIEANIDSFADLTNNVMRVGTATYINSEGKGVIEDDGSFSFKVVATGSDNTNLEESGQLQYRVHVDYPRRSDNSHPSQAFGWYSIYTNSDITDLEQAQKLEPSWQSDLAAALELVVPGMVAAAIADNPTVVTAAANLAQSDVGLIRFSTGDGVGLRFEGSNGERTAIGLDGTGQWDDVAHWARANQDHYSLGHEQPYVWPGNYLYWDRTNPITGDFIETVKMVNS